MKTTFMATVFLYLSLLAQEVWTRVANSQDFDANVLTDLGGNAQIGWNAYDGEFDIANQSEEEEQFQSLDQEEIQLQLYTPPQLTGEATKFCNGFCRKAAGFITCEAGCKGVNKAACEAAAAACKIGCVFSKKCRDKCMRTIYDPCVRELVKVCHERCIKNLVNPCVNGCSAKAHKGCVEVSSKLFQTKIPRVAYCGALTTAVLAAGIPVFGPFASVAGGVVGVGCGIALAQISDADYNACNSIAKGKVCGEQLCTAMGL